MQSCNPWCLSSTNYFGLSLRLDEERKKKKKRGRLKDKNSALLFTSAFALSIQEETSQLWVPGQLPRKQMSATETSGCEVRNSEIHEPRWNFSDFLIFSKIIIFWKWLYWDVRYCIQTAASWETQYPWEMLRTGNHGAWVQKMKGKVS